MRKRILTEDDLKRNLSEFTEDSNHRTVTDKEKTDWNKKLDNIVNVDSSKSKTKGNAKAGKWTGVGTVRNLEDWVGDFNARSIENRDNIKANKNTIEEVRKSIRGIAAEYTYPEIIFSNTTNLGEVLNQSFKTNFYNVNNISKLTSSATAMSELCNNDGALNLALKSDRFLNSVINSNVAMYNIANDSKAMKLVAQSRFALKKFFYSKNARLAMANNSTSILALLESPWVSKEYSYNFSDNAAYNKKVGYPLISTNPNWSIYNTKIAEEDRKKGIYQDTKIRANKKIDYKGSSYYIVFNSVAAEWDEPNTGNEEKNNSNYFYFLNLLGL